MLHYFKHKHNTTSFQKQMFEKAHDMIWIKRLFLLSRRRRDFLILPFPSAEEMSTILIKSWMKISSLMVGPIWNSQGWSEYDILGWNHWLFCIDNQDHQKKYGLCCMMYASIYVHMMKMRMLVVEVSRQHQSVMSFASSRDRPSPLFNWLTRPKAPDTELNQGKEKTDAGKIREIAHWFRWKAEKFKVEKLTRVKIREIAGKFEIGNYLELRWWKIGSRLHFKSWLAHHRRRGVVGWGGQKLMKEFKLT